MWGGCPPPPPPSKPALQIPTLSAHLSICRPEVEFIIWGDGGSPPRDERAEQERRGPVNERPRCDPTGGGKHMFCWSWQAGILRRGLGIPSSGRDGGMEKVEEEEEKEEAHEAP